MKILKNMTIGKKLISSFTLLITLISAVLVGVSYFNTTRMAENLTNNALQLKIDGDIQSARLYENHHYGRIEMVDNRMVDREGNPIEGNFTMVDAIADDLGVVATVFAREDNDFRRISTNIRQADGSRAVGTLLGTDSAAYQPVMQRELYIGQAMILGLPYFTAYQPIVNAQEEVIGILFLGIPQAELDAIIADNTSAFLRATALSFLALLAIATFITIGISRSITRPIVHAADMLKDISEGEGDLTRRLPADSQDELGSLARYFNAFVEKLQGIIRDVAGNAVTVASSATELSAVSAQTGQSVATTSSKISTIAAAAEESTVNTTSVAAGMEQVSVNLSSVASATEEMSTTINEISANTEKARGISAQAGEQATQVADLMQRLGTAAQEIGKVTETITGISSQTNLLALNATIEAARAGEAGKGFAVVAHEIKELAQQTAAATEDIKAKIGGVQTSAGSVIADIEKITSVVGDVGQIVSSIATAIEEQAAVTRDVADNLAQASAGMQDANERVAQTASVSRDMAQDIASVDAAAGDMRTGGEQVQSSAAELSELAEQLKALVGQFKV